MNRSLLLKIAFILVILFFILFYFHFNPNFKKKKFPKDLTLGNERFDTVEKLNTFQLMRDFKESPILIYFNNTNLKSKIQMVPCDVPCKMTKVMNFQNYFLIDGLISFESSIPIPRKSNRQKTIYLSNHPNSIPEKFDIYVTPKLSSTITNVIYNYKNLNYFKKLYNGKRKLAVSFIENCEENEIIKQLKLNGVNVDCMDGLDPKEIIIEKYYFNIILEREKGNDFIGRNYFLTLSAGAIPVYQGSLNVDAYEPQHHFILKIKEIPELAKQMKQISSDKKLFESKFNWKQNEMKLEFKTILDDASTDLFCKICQKVGDSYQLDLQTNKILIRERNSFYFKELNFKIGGKLKEFHESIIHLFGISHSPLWSRYRLTSGKLKIFKIFEITENGESFVYLKPSVELARSYLW
jgi:hypothetical protein